MPSNQILLDYASNPDLAEFFSTKSPGDKCCLEVTFLIKELNGKTVDGAIEKVSYEDAPESSKPAKEDEDAAEPTEEEPIMMKIMSRTKLPESNAYVPG